MCEISRLDLSKVDWAASVKFNQLAQQVAEWACGPHGPFRASVAHDRNALSIISKPYWPQDDLAAAAQSVGCTPQEVLGVILAYRE